MRITLSALFLLFALAARAACEPADPKAIAAAERKAADARYKADQAEATAVKSGNPGAALRAKEARADATLLDEDLARLQCRDPGLRKAPTLMQSPR
jgi:hypothetical protein